MPELVNEGSYRISGRFGEGFYVPPAGGTPIKIMEATQIEFTSEVGATDVPLSGNRTGSKDGPESHEGTMVIQLIDNFFDNIIYNAFAGNLAERRRARDRGERVARYFTLQVWLDDPEALGAMGWQIEGVRLRRLQGGFNFGDEITTREHPFRYEGAPRRIRAFERIGNSIDPATGLPATRYTHDLGALPAV
jgi:hypothetical protein